MFWRRTGTTILATSPLCVRIYVLPITLAPGSRRRADAGVVAEIAISDREGPFCGTDLHRRAALFRARIDPNLRARLALIERQSDDAAPPGRDPKATERCTTLRGTKEVVPRVQIQGQRISGLILQAGREHDNTRRDGKPASLLAGDLSRDRIGSTPL